MKRLSLICLFVFYSLYVLGQKEATNFKNKQLQNSYLAQTELKNQLITHDFSSVFTHSDNSIIYGFIGNNYQRIRIKLIKVTKDLSSPDTYHIYGKSMVKNNIDKFNGTIKIANIRKVKAMSYGVDDEYKNKGIRGEYVILADYNFSENKGQNHSGVFKGVCESDFYLDKNSAVHYDDIEMNADGYTNNQFVGQWTDYKTNIAKRCNWGDFRIPDSGHFDIGAGDFSPNGYDGKYTKNGWQNMDDEKTEKAKWWE